MRGVNLNQFEFDYDLTWAGFFINAQGKVYGRYGGRDEKDAEKHLSLAGLKYAMKQALLTHKKSSEAKPKEALTPVRRAEQLPAAKRMKADSCIHCHQVREFRRKEIRAKGNWTRDQTWIFPPPQNIGIILNTDQGDLVDQVVKNSAAAEAGLKKGDVLQAIDGRSVASFADAQYALHKVGNKDKVIVKLMRNNESMKTVLGLKKGWRKSDISWRASMWALQPQAHVYGKDLTAKEKKALGLTEKQLAFRQGRFVPNPSRKAGIRGNDIIIGIDGQKLEMNMLQFNVHIRLNKKIGQTITYDVIRGKKRLKIPMKLTSKPAW